MAISVHTWNTSFYSHDSTCYSQIMRSARISLLFLILCPHIHRTPSWHSVQKKIAVCHFPRSLKCISNPSTLSYIRFGLFPPVPWKIFFICISTVFRCNLFLCAAYFSHSHWFCIRKTLLIRASCSVSFTLCTTQFHSDVPLDRLKVSVMLTCGCQCGG